MSIIATPSRRAKLAPKKGGFLLSLNSISELDRQHLWGSLFPLIAELKTKVQTEKKQCPQSDL
jgi:hypothetical protein